MPAFSFDSIQRCFAQQRETRTARNSFSAHRGVGGSFLRSGARRRCGFLQLTQLRLHLLFDQRMTLSIRKRDELDTQKHQTQHPNKTTNETPNNKPQSSLRWYL